MARITADLERAVHAVAVFISSELRHVGVSQAEAHVLLYALDAGPAPIGDLHRSFGHRRSTLTSVVDRLEARGLVERAPNPRDRRSSLVALTSDGRNAARQVARVLNGLETRVRERAGEDVAAFGRVVAAVEEAAR
jgi:DNA-binding MarR family transcriptional regulator